jgi:DNA gyrase subunit A
VDTLRVMGRATQGVKVIRLKDNDSIASVAKVSKFEEDEEVLLDEEGNIIETLEVSENQVSLESKPDSNQEDKNNDNNQKENENEEN